MSGTTAKATEILARLVAFDTTSSKTNIPCAEFVQDYLAGDGIEARLLPADDGIHANLFATIGPDGDGGIGLSGHMDVVPVTSQKWDTDPFTLTERDGRLYGRGACDMKGYLACVLAMAPEFKAAQLEDPRSHRLLLRRGGRLHRRQADDRRDGPHAAQAAPDPRRRADHHDRRRCAQGRLSLLSRR